MTFKNPLWTLGITLFVVPNLLCLPLAAELVELPTDLPLNAASVTLDLWNADVDIILDPTANATLQARSATDEPTEAHLDQTFIEGVLTVRTAVTNEAGEADDRGRLKVDLVLGAEQSVHLIGRDLRVTARELRHTGVTDALGLQLTLESSELNMDGGRDTAIEAIQTSIWLTASRGLLTLNLESGSAELRDHQGGVQLEATDAEITVVDLEGKFEPRITGGSLDVRGGSGRIESQADDATVLLTEWRGAFTLTGEGSTVEAHGTGDDPSPWKLTGTDLQITLADHIGPVTGQLVGGRWDATTLGGTVSVSASRGTVVELTDLAQSVVLKLSDQATGQLTNLQSNTRAEVQDARLEATNTGPFSLTAVGSEIEIRQVEGKVDLMLTDSDLELDLTVNHEPSQHQANLFPSLKLFRSGQSRVWLEAPCEVRIQGDQGENYDRIRVSGCRLQLPGQPTPRREHHMQGENRPRILTVTTDPDVELEVEGQ